MRYFWHILGITILGLFVASFFIGLKINPEFADIASSPYGLFTYFVITVLTAFIPSLATLPVVTTATLIWGPWIAGSMAVLGWTIGSIIEYYATYYAMDLFINWFRKEKLKDKIGRVKNALKFWQVFVARLFIPPFVFGLVKTKFSHYFWASILAYIPLATGGVIGGELLKGRLEEIQPLFLGAAFILLIFTIDFLFVKK